MSDFYKLSSDIQSQTVKGYECRVKWSAEDNYYIGEVPDLPGCMADGETIEELCKELEEHIELWLEVNEERGFLIPESTLNVKK